MNRKSRNLISVGVGAVTGLLCLSVDETALIAREGALMSRAHAIIGRPLTPMSYAGVARRTTRRAVVGGAMVAPVVVAPVAPVVVAPRCVQAVDVYGRVFTRCY